MELAFVSTPQIKQEIMDPFALVENFEATEIDPMNLLEVGADRCSTEEREESLLENDVSGSATQKRSLSNAEKWREWMQDRPWLLHEEQDERQGFCLYCGLKLMVYSSGQIKRHELSTRHEERARNYLAFQRSAYWSEEGVPIKAESGTDSRLPAAEFRRLLQTDALNDFNWSRWLEAHTWLVRKSREGTKGSCKYCQLELNAEFTLDRQRHEESLRHKVAEKQYWLQQKKEVSNDGECNNVNTNTEDNPETSNVDEQQDNDGDNNADKNSADTAKIALKGPWYEAVNNKTCRCRLCNVLMEKTSFYKHIKSQLHHANVSGYKKKNTANTMTEVPTNRKVMEIDWKRFAKIHPWLTADPQNAKYAYCTYCDKRFMYGLSSVKRYMHENSASHKQAMNQQIQNAQEMNALHESRSDNDADENEENEDENSDAEDQTQDEEENSEESVQEDVQQETDASGGEEGEQEVEDNDDTEEESKSKKERRIKRGSDYFFSLYPYYKRYRKNPAYIYCTICKIPLKSKFCRSKHERTSRHRSGVDTKPVPHTLKSSNISAPVKGNVSNVYPWLILTKNKKYRCKYCRVVLSGNYSRKQHELTKRHKLNSKYHLQQSNKLATKGGRGGANAHGSLKKQSMQSRVMLWKVKFPWITYKRNELRKNYAYCHYCEQSLFVPTPKYATKHQRTGRHIRARNLLHRRRAERERDAGQQGNEDSTNDDSGGPNMDSFDWLELKDGSKKAGYCKYCQKDVLISGFMKSQHQNLREHRKAAAMYLKRQRIWETSNKNEGGENNTDDDVGTDVNSEQESEKCNENGEPPTKRARHEASDASVQSLATRLTATHAEMLSLMRELHKRKGTSSGSNFLNTTPFSIAACLSSLRGTEKSTATEIPREQAVTYQPSVQQERNIYDLFFESMSETVKRLPPDLAAESRIKVMQIIYDLEVQALRRSTTPEHAAKNDPIATPATSNASTSAGTQTAVASDTVRLVTKLRQVRRNSTIEFIPVNGHISPLCKET